MDRTDGGSKSQLCTNRANEATKHSTGVWMCEKFLEVTETWDTFHVFQEAWNQQCPLGNWKCWTLLMKWNLDHEINNKKCERMMWLWCSTMYTLYTNSLFC
jgi:hypothetical protein